MRGKYELGRYKKKVADQEKEIRELRDQTASYQQLLDISYAMVGAVVAETGPVAIRQDDINRILAGETLVQVHYNAEDRSYLLRMDAGGETDGEGKTC